jgi:hypothetical protein
MLQCVRQSGSSCRLGMRNDILPACGCPTGFLTTRVLERENNAILQYTAANEPQLKRRTHNRKPTAHTHTQTAGQSHEQHDTQLCRLLLAVRAMKPEGTNCAQPAQEHTQQPPQHSKALR